MHTAVPNLTIAAGACALLAAVWLCGREKRRAAARAAARRLTWIAEEIDACTMCGRYPWTKRPDCRACTEAVDDRIAATRAIEVALSKLEGE